MLQPIFIWQKPKIVPGEINKELAQFSPVFRSVLYNRGVRTNQEAIDLLLPREPGWFSALLPRGVGTASQVIQSVIERGQKIAVFGDYDADGITATALATLALRKIMADVTPYIPDRLNEGYGLNNGAIKFLSDQGVKLILTVDNGIKSHQEIEFAKSLGLDMIITDHHTPDQPYPDASAVINPKLPDDPYPNKELAGVGVAYKLICGLASIYDDLVPEDYLDLVAIGTIADIVPLIGENRYLVRQGLSRINLKNRPGIRALIGVSGMGIKQIQSSDISFQIAPRLNSSGRLDEGSADTPLSLMLSQNFEECARIAQILENDNYRRKSLSRELERSLDDHFSSQPDLPSVLIYINEIIPQGIAGIAAGFLARKFNRPAIVGSLRGDLIVASCRSIPAFSMIDALNSTSDLFDRFGGHDQAAGFTIQSSNLAEFESRLLDLAKKQMDVADLRSLLAIDAHVKLIEIDSSLHKELQKLEPTGEMNPTPILFTGNLHAANRSLIGKNKEHLKMSVTDGKTTVDTIGFNLGHLSNVLPSSFDLVYHLTLNEFRGQKKIQLQILDIKPSPEK